jgi:hypothetical protein
MELLQQFERYHLKQTQINTELDIYDRLDGTVRQMRYIQEHPHIH